MPRLSAVLIVRDEAEMIRGCLERLTFADEILVLVDDRTVDGTAHIAAQAGARVVHAPFTNFAAFRQTALREISGDWAFMVDADERVTAALAHEIEAAVEGPRAAYRVPIENWFYGHRVRRTGYRERPIRLFPVTDAMFAGDIHEELVVAPELPVRTLRPGLVHMSHRSVAENLGKTRVYAEIQAAEMLQSGYRPVTRRSLVGVALKTLFRHLVVGQGFRDGTPGVIESFYQAFSTFCVHARLWELQQTPSPNDRYAELERTLR